MQGEDTYMPIPGKQQVFFEIFLSLKKMKLFRIKMITQILQFFDEISFICKDNDGKESFSNLEFLVCNRFTGWLRVSGKIATLRINSRGFDASNDTKFKLL
jgi:hypothetical protein